MSSNKQYILLFAFTEYSHTSLHSRHFGERVACKRLRNKTKQNRQILTGLVLSVLDLQNISSAKVAA